MQQDMLFGLASVELPLPDQVEVVVVVTGANVGVVAVGWPSRFEPSLATAAGWSAATATN